MNDKTCPHCKQRYTPIRTFQKHCLETACIEKGNEKLREAKRKVNRRAKKDFYDSDPKTMKRRAEIYCNRFIRLRDGNHCISCGYEGTKRDWHAGHYKPKGGHQRLRYDEKNINVQCEPCNRRLAGNLVPYRANLIKKIGEDEVIRLETTKAPKRWNVEELKEIIEYYKNKIKDIS